MREEVEEYKRRQRRAEAEAAGAEDPDPDHDPDDDPEDDEHDWTGDHDLANASPAGSGVNVAKLVSNIFLSVGLLLLLVSAGLFWVTREALVKEISAPGVVTSNILRYHARSSDDRSRSEGTSDLYHAVVEFRLADGTAKTVEMSEGNWPKAYEEGEKVTVRYDPEKPLKARLGGGGAMDFFASLLTGFLGAVFTAVAIGARRAFLSE
jgi:hypothetical protein